MFMYHIVKSLVGSVVEEQEETISSQVVSPKKKPPAITLERESPDKCLVRMHRNEGRRKRLGYFLLL